MYPSPFEVDHIVELQTAGWPASGEANTLPNMELLDKSSNASAGASTKSGIRTKVGDYLAAKGEPSGKAKIDDFLEKNPIEFNRVEMGGGRDESASQWWTRDESIAGEHLKDAKPVRGIAEAASAKP